MSRFAPPNIDSSLTQEAQQVVSEASAKMDDWLNNAFDKLDKEFESKLIDIENKLNTEYQTYMEEEQHSATQLMQQLQQLQIATQQLTPLDPEQNDVIEKLNKLVIHAEAENTARANRWKSFGSKAVNIAHVGLKSIF